MHPEQIKALMRMSGISSAILAERLRVSPSCVSQTILGKIMSPRIRREIADVIGKRVSEIWPNARPRLRRTREEMEVARRPV